MTLFTPGQFKQSLLKKIKETEEVASEEKPPLQIKKDAEEFTPRASDYHASDKNQRQEIRDKGTAQLPKESVLNKPIHERMKDFVKNQYGK